MDHETCNGTGRLTDTEAIIRQKLLQAHPELTEAQAKTAVDEAKAEILNSPAPAMAQSASTAEQLEAIVLPKRKPGRPKMRIV